MKLYLNIFLLVCISTTTNSQDILNLEKAIDLALTNNHQIKITKNETVIAKKNNHIGNAGFLPTISATSNYNQSYSDVNLDIAPTPNEIISIEENNANSNTFLTAISLNYTLFAGMKRVYSLKKLENYELIANSQEKQIIEETILKVINKYMEIANKQNEYELHLLNKNISKERFNRLKQLYELGGTSQIEMLTSELDLNNDLIKLYNSEVQLNSSKRDLLILIGLENLSFEVSKEVIFNSNINFRRLDSLATLNNTNIKIAKYNNAIAEQNIKLIQSEFYPTISFTSSYFYSDISNNASITPYIKNKGFEGVISLQFPLFNNNINRKNLSISKIENLNAQQLVIDAQKNISTALKNTYNAYTEGLKIIQLMSKNLEIAHTNFLFSKDLYDAGQLSSIEYREAQSKFINTQIELGRLNYNTKIQEYILYQLAGILIED